MLPSISRRTTLAGLGASLALPTTLRAQTTSDFTIDWQGGEQSPDLLAALDRQIGIVKALRIKPEAAAFFAAQVVTVDRQPGTKTRAGPRGVFFQRSPLPPPDNPVLLHELLHRYHFIHLPGGVDNPTIIQFYQRAKANPQWPAQAYMYSRLIEFFAMVTSCVLYGHVARPPYTRDAVKRNLPDFYAWTVAEFGLEI